MTRPTTEKDGDSIKTIVEGEQTIQSNNLFYHGSGFKNEILRPGFFYTKKEVIWDQTESNKFLYVTTDYKDAVLLGWSSHLEKKFHIKNFHINQQDITIVLDQGSEQVSLTDLMLLPVYVYTIPNRSTDNWVLVNNQFNRYKKEYKTDNFITGIDKIETINMVEWLQKNHFKVKLRRDYDHPKADISEPIYTKW